MLRKLAAMLSLTLMAVLVAVPSTSAQDKTEGTFDLVFNDCAVIPSETIPDWIGTAEIDGNVHDMLFFNLGIGRPPGQALEAPLGSFIEVWAIYDGVEVVFDEDCAMEKLEGDLLLWGHDYGVGDGDAAEFAMTGTVVEAFGEYADLAGSDIEMSGTFYVNDDGRDQAPGVFTIG